ncbi:MAG: hypothetical protein RLZZ584_3778, partial [Pseudomonadota bacterium]
MPCHAAAARRPTRSTLGGMAALLALAAAWLLGPAPAQAQAKSHTLV